MGNWGALLCVCVCVRMRRIRKTRRGTLELRGPDCLVVFYLKGWLCTRVRRPNLCKLSLIYSRGRIDLFRVRLGLNYNYSSR